MLVFFIINCSFDLSSDISNKKTVYMAKNNNKYFFLSLFFSFSKPFENILRKIKFNFCILYIEKLKTTLKILNYPFNEFNPYNFIVFQFFIMFLSMLFAFVLIGNDILILVCTGILFFILPYLKIVEEYKKIIRDITKQLPNLCDLLSIMLVSGVDFHNSITKVSYIISGTLSDELKDVVIKVNLGIDIKTALEETAKKYNIEQLNLFVRTVKSSLESGLGMSEALDTISNQLKVEDAAIAQKQAHEAPVKMLLPMTFLILPTIFILLFAPMILSFIKNGSLL
jgi:tight adherence protein C